MNKNLATAFIFTLGFYFGSNLDVNGYTKLGSDAPAIKMKKLTGTTASTEGGIVTINHGITDFTKILTVNVVVNDDGTMNSDQYEAGTTAGEYEFSVDWNSTIIRVINHATNSNAILNEPFTVLIIYEE